MSSTDIAGLIERLRVLERMGLLKTPVDAIYGEAATALQTLTDKVEALEAALRFRPSPSETFSYQAEGYATGWNAAIEQYRANANAALTKEGKSA